MLVALFVLMLRLLLAFPAADLLGPILRDRASTGKKFCHSSASSPFERRSFAAAISSP